MPEGRSDWVFPYWLERQLDPASADYTPLGGSLGLTEVHHATGTGPYGGRPRPGGFVAEPVNTTNRDWTLIGNLASWRRATVDPRGLVTPVEGGWSLDWWIGADDRWHLPSREAAVRQQLTDHAPVVETAMRVPGGDVVHRAYAVRPSADECVVVEIENATAVPVAVALVVRPFHPTGMARVERVGLDATGLVVHVDDAPAIVFPKPASRAAWSTLAGGDCLVAVLAGGASEDGLAALRDTVGDADGFAQAAFVFPLAHTAKLRVALPLNRPTQPTRPGRMPSRGSRSVEIPAIDAGALPEATRVASGWQTQGSRGVRLDLPDLRLRDAVESARRHLLVVHGGEDLATVPSQPFDYSEAAAVLGALDAYGYADEVEQILATWSERQRSDGWFAGVEGRSDGNGAALHALAQHWRFTRTLDQTAEHALLIARAAHAIDKRRSGSRRRGRPGPVAAGLLPPGEGPRAGGPPGVWVRDAVWSLQGLGDAAELLAVLDQRDAAEEVGGFRRRLASELAEALASRPGGAWPSTMARGADLGTIVNLDALNLPCALHDEVPGAAETLDAIRRDAVVGAAVHQAVGPAGLSARYTAMLARAELHRPHEGPGPGRAVAAGAVADGPDATVPDRDRLGWLLGHASPTWAWPEARHPTRGGGTVGAGHDGVANAWFLQLVRDMVVRETGRGRLALCSVWPRSWLGQGLEVHDAPTAEGRVSFAVRWHGERPALLWELERHEGDQRDSPDDPRPAVVLTVPGLDPSWSSSEPKGEALLGVPLMAATRQLDAAELEGESFA